MILEVTSENSLNNDNRLMQKVPETFKKCNNELIKDWSILSAHSSLAIHCYLPRVAHRRVPSFLPPIPSFAQVDWRIWHHPLPPWWKGNQLQSNEISQSNFIIIPHSLHYMLEFLHFSTPCSWFFFHKKSNRTRDILKERKKIWQNYGWQSNNC